MWDQLMKHWACAVDTSWKYYCWEYKNIIMYKKHVNDWGHKRRSVFCKSLLKSQFVLNFNCSRFPLYVVSLHLNLFWTNKIFDGLVIFLSIIDKGYLFFFFWRQVHVKESLWQLKARLIPSEAYLIIKVHATFMYYFVLIVITECKIVCVKRHSTTWALFYIK